ncbi:MAG: response regulator [Spirochaetes bacterium]|nr:response regulator [Spirochaetota bacterium]
MKLLIAEDDNTSREILTAFFSKYGYEVTAVDNGSKALEIMEEPDSPDLVILDWIMPEIDGLEVCRRIRKNKKSQLPYIIMLTIKGNTDDIITALSDGADDYMSKPYDTEELKARVDVGMRLVNFILKQQEAERKITELFTEKELLLKEVHHRVKNNISTIESMLRLQADLIQDGSFRHILNDAAGRVQSMRILYEKLLPASDYKNISVKAYLDDLITAILNLFPSKRYILFKNEIGDYTLSEKILIPLGIILNEMITNIMKYAFDDGQSGVINIEFQKHDSEYVLKVMDNGRGLPDNFDVEKSAGYGLMLIKLLASQIKGSFSIRNKNGVVCEVMFNV